MTTDQAGCTADAPYHYTIPLPRLSSHIMMYQVSQTPHSVMHCWPLHTAHSADYGAP